MSATKPAVNPFLKMALELGPLVVFFFTNARGDDLVAAFPALAGLGDRIFIATAFFMVAMVISLILSKLLTGEIAVAPLITGAFVLVFGGLTLLLQNDTFIKMKPTIVNCLFGGTLLIGLVFGKSLLALVFGSAFQLDEEGWRKLTFRWGWFFFVLAAINEGVWRTFSTDTWVAFKVWGVMPLTIVFMLAQFPLLQRHSTEPLFGEDEDKQGSG